MLYIVVPHAANEFADNLFYLWSKFFANLSRQKKVYIVDMYHEELNLL
jgi:hypothetical protein